MKFLHALLAFLLVGCSGPPSVAETSPAAPANAAQATARVGEVTISNDSRRSAPARVFSFGQIFLPGSLRRGEPVQLVADGRRLPTQIDAKALNPDGSVRHAVVSVELPQLSGGETVAATLVKGGGAQAPAAGALSPAPDLEVTLQLIDGAGKRQVVFDLPTIIAAAAGQKPDLWLSGPLGEERRYVVDADRRLQIAFDVFRPRSGPSRVDVIFHNDWNDLKPDDDVRYDVDITVDGKTAFKARGVRHYPRSTWHRLVWSDGADPLRAAPKLSDLAAAGATPNYAPRFIVTKDVRAELAQAARSISDEPLNSGSITRYMPTTGLRMDIGPLPTWAAVDLMDGDALSRRLTLANADAGGSIPWHIRERATKQPLTLDKYPQLWLDSRAEAYAPLAQPFLEEANDWTIDQAHQPSLAYAPYLVTGLRYYKDELTQQAAFVLLTDIASYRGDAAGLFIGADGSAWDQVRALAWSLRTVATAAYILPKADPMQAYFDGKLKGNLAKIVQTFVTERKMQSAGPLEGWMPGAYRPEGATAPWQQGYLAMVLGWIDHMGYADAGRTLGWMSNFLAGLFTSGRDGFDPRFGTAYVLMVYDDEDGRNYASWAEAARASGLERSSAGGDDDPYAMIMRGGLASAYAVDRLPRTKAAYDYVTRRAGVTAEGGDPTYAIVPR